VEDQRQRVVDAVRVGVEALFFAEDSISLSIYDLVKKYTWKHISRSLGIRNMHLHQMKEI
jgi:hypothetical protein